MKNKRIVSLIKSSEFAVWIAILSVVVQSFHSYTAFYNTSSLQGSTWGVAQAVLFSVVIDLAILFYTVRNRRDVASYAALCMVVINAYYYYQHLGLSFSFGFGVFLSLLIPVSVYYYSEEINKDTEYPSIADAYKIEALEGQIERLKSDIMQAREKRGEYYDAVVKVSNLQETLKYIIRQQEDTLSHHAKLKFNDPEIEKIYREILVPEPKTHAPEDTSLVSVKEDEGIIQDKNFWDRMKEKEERKAIEIPNTDRPLRT